MNKPIWSPLSSFSIFLSRCFTHKFLLSSHQIPEDDRWLINDCFMVLNNWRPNQEEMNVSHGSVHPVEDVPTTDGAVPHPLRVRMKDLPGMPGTHGGLALRLSQLFFSAAALVVMATTSDFPSVTAFWWVAPHSTNPYAIFSFVVFLMV